MTSSIIIDPAALPLRPGTATQVLELLDDPETSAVKISELVRTEPAITARLLALANSPVFSRGRAIADINRAVIVVGLSAVRGIALGVAMDSLFEDHADLDPAHWDHALVTAGAAMVSAQQLDADPGEAFCAGLMLDLGQIAMAISSAENWATILAQTNPNTSERLQLETELYATDHARLGSEVLTKFRLPPRLTVCGQRTSPTSGGGGLPAGALRCGGHGDRGDGLSRGWHSSGRQPRRTRAQLQRNPRRDHPTGQASSGSVCPLVQPILGRQSQWSAANRASAVEASIVHELRSWCSRAHATTVG